MVLVYAGMLPQHSPINWTFISYQNRKWRLKIEKIVWVGKARHIFLVDPFSFIFKNNLDIQIWGRYWRKYPEQLLSLLSGISVRRSPFKEFVPHSMFIRRNNVLHLPVVPWSFSLCVILNKAKLPNYQERLFCLKVKGQILKLISNL